MTDDIKIAGRAKRRGLKPEAMSMIISLSISIRLYIKRTLANPAIGITIDSHVGSNKIVR
jgi:hypothetical protein